MTSRGHRYAAGSATVSGTKPGSTGPSRGMGRTTGGTVAKISFLNYLFFWYFQDYVANINVFLNGPFFLLFQYYVAEIFFFLQKWTIFCFSLDPMADISGF